ncbi:heparinase II/III-family protein [Parasphingorhabdus flavimaris]|uniref:Heparinase II/III-family protein n=1 Tax=Parasphingorhabdus flavimaris TaxID=266812 RepID=A0ABX2N5T2_9SPHN|nr:heparinase II/III-family protein [Parasphingorhabdus flavimaris]NVD29034.1 heparinase II/III-family protein [Parasphingorhabdus flavimaris]
MNLATKARAYIRLGWRSLLDVGLYRAGLKTGLHPVLKIVPVVLVKGDFFIASNRSGPLPAPTPVWQDQPWAFGKACGAPSDDPPDWHANILTGSRVKDVKKRWDKVSVFSADIGDIKAVWEPSRFDWVIAFAQNAALGKSGAMDKLNRWLTDWTEHNPAYNGPNWICGQEASIRTAHLVLAAILLGNEDTLSAPLESLLLQHLRRIAPTIAYARGQDNNHATSEAMALYAGGLWISRCCADNDRRAEALKYMQAGQALAENRVRALILNDGGFAQYSHVYHRLMLDSLSVMELVRRAFGAPDFSAEFVRKAASASEWLRFFTEPVNGEVPNMGSNDGAWLLPIGPGRSRDFRPSCALASTLFEGKTAFSETASASALLQWLSIRSGTPIGVEVAPPVRLFAESAIAAISSGDWRIYMRLPGTKFRPHQADALHLDVWRGGSNLLCDAGTYSYAETGWEYFSSTAAHNTIEFDGRDQMPRVGRFLYGEWLRREEVHIDGQADQPSIVSSYTDFQGVRHIRKVAVVGDSITITDTVKGRFRTAKIRWRKNHSSVRISTASDAVDYVKESGPSSLYYMSKKYILILVGTLSRNGTIVTKVTVDIGKSA